MTNQLHADLVLRGGNIATLDPTNTVVEAIAARDGRIVALGGDVAGLIGPDTEVIDLAGRTAIPGIIDSHCHPDAHAISLLKEHDLSWPGMQSFDDVLATISRVTAASGPDDWFFGYRYDDNKLAMVPTIDRLDAAGQGRPVFIQRTDGPSVSRHTDSPSLRKLLR